MLRRLSIVGSLLSDPELLVLDEPFDGLDPLGSGIVREELLRRAASGAAVLLSSHALADLEAVATHLTVLASGRILEQGAIDEVLARRDQMQLVVKGLAKEAIPRLRRELSQQGAELLSSSPDRESLEDLFRRKMREGRP
jgi:ABC-2 type transport system ATP-binding protein